MTNVQKVWRDLAVGIIVFLASGALIFGAMLVMGKYGWLVPIALVIAAFVFGISLLIRLALKNARDKDAKEAAAKR